MKYYTHKNSPYFVEDESPYYMRRNEKGEWVSVNLRKKPDGTVFTKEDFLAFDQYVKDGDWVEV
jgi:hypothetical protein